MGGDTLTRRSFLLGALGAAAGMAGCSGSSPVSERGTTGATTTTVAPLDCTGADARGPRPPLWETAIQRGIVYGSSAATWQLADEEYRRLFEREAAILFTEDDLLWWRLRPTPRSDLQFKYGDEIIGFADRHRILPFGAHLVWDDGFGEGWTSADLFGLDTERARDLLFGSVERVVRRYRGRVAGWIVVNEALDDFGVRTDVPWYSTIGPSYVSEAFQVAHEADPDATLVLNDFGYETDDFVSAVHKREVTLRFVDDLLDARVPVHALGVQAHLQAGGFAEAFDPTAYREFLGDVAERGLSILITELDVLDDGLPADSRVRDRAVADTISRYLEAALDEPAVGALMTFGLSDRYTWLQEDFPREDGARRRPLPFDEKLRPKPAYEALAAALANAPRRNVLWRPRRC